MNSYSKGMTITLDDNNEYVILKIKVIDNVQYAYIQNINDVNDDGFVLLGDNSLEVVTDIEKIKYLMDNL